MECRICKYSKPLTDFLKNKSFTKNLYLMQTEKGKHKKGMVLNGIILFDFREKLINILKITEKHFEWWFLQ